MPQKKQEVMNMFKRKRYLNKLIQKKENGRIKIITGVRRCGKSFLLFELYHQYLNEHGIQNDQIVGIALDGLTNARYRNPLELDQYIRSLVEHKKETFYVFIDGIQLVSMIDNPYINDGKAKIGFVDVVLGLMKIKNLDLYITGSNSRMLSSDILTEFKDRGDEIRVYPISYKEFYDVNLDKAHAWIEYYTYGGMPHAVLLETHEEKSEYLKDLFSKTYISDVIERNKILNDKGILEDLLNVISSSVGSLTNPTKLERTFKSVKHIIISHETIHKYLEYFMDAFILERAYVMM